MQRKSAGKNIGVDEGEKRVSGAPKEVGAPENGMIAIRWA